MQALTVDERSASIISSIGRIIGEINEAPAGLAGAGSFKATRRRVIATFLSNDCFAIGRDLLSADPFCLDPPLRPVIPFVYGAGVSCSRRFIRRIMSGRATSAFSPFFLSSAPDTTPWNFGECSRRC